MIKQWVALCLLVFFLVDPSLVFAEEEQSWIIASRWARANEGLAIAVTLGADVTFTADEFSNFMEGKFRDDYDIISKVFVEETGIGNSTIIYFFGTSATEFELLSVGASAERREEISKLFRISSQ